MRVFLCGGGADEQTADVNKMYGKIIDNSKPVLYLPAAMPEEAHEGCKAWISAELRPYGIEKTVTLSNVFDFPDDLSLYSSIFIGGGNTYRLLTLLKRSGAFGKIAEYAATNGVVMGGSAGAIVFGRDIRCSDYADENITGLEDTGGFDILNGWDVCCHYTNGNAERNAYEHRVISEYTRKGSRIFALPEETHLFVENGGFTVIGPGKCHVFENGAEKTLNPGQYFSVARR